MRRNGINSCYLFNSVHVVSVSMQRSRKEHLQMMTLLHIFAQTYHIMQISGLKGALHI